MNNKEMISAKQYEISSWIEQLRHSETRVLVSNYCYNCLLTQKPKAKTLIVFPEEIERKGIIVINKPIEKVEMIDIIKIYKKINL